MKIIILNTLLLPVTIPDTILSLLIHYRYFVVIPVAIVEGPIVTVIAAFLASQGYFNIFIIYVVVVLGDVIGDFIYYGLGRWGKNGLIKRWGKYIGLREGRLDMMETYFKSKSGRLLLFGKLTHSAGFLVLISAGAAKVSIKDFFWYNLLGTLPKSLIFLLIGYFLGAAYNQIDSYIGKISLVLFVGILIFVGLYYLFFKHRSDNKDILYD